MITVKQPEDYEEACARRKRSQSTITYRDKKCKHKD
jgi:hypothetical protein